MRLWGIRRALGKSGRELTPDEVAAIGRPLMIRNCLHRAAMMRPDLADAVERLAGTVTPYDDEARYWALKIVWTREGKS